MTRLRRLLLIATTTTLLATGAGLGAAPDASAAVSRDYQGYTRIAATQNASCWLWGAYRSIRLHRNSFGYTTAGFAGRGYKHNYSYANGLWCLVHRTNLNRA